MPDALPFAVPPVVAVPTTTVPLVEDTRPAVPLADTLTPASFVHPQASRELMLGAARVAYEFKRGKRRTIGFVVGAEGLSVRAPRWVALRDVDAAVREKSDWILRKLAETQQRHARVEATRIDWKDGAGFPSSANRWWCGSIRSTASRAWAVRSMRAMAPVSYTHLTLPTKA